MDIIRSVHEMQNRSGEWRSHCLTIGFVPTMGFLHEGHLDLVRHARDKCDRLVVSIFVNPKQFGPKEDLSDYPRDLERDLGLLEPIGVDAIFHPEPLEIYPPDHQTRVEVTGVTRGLCGAFRPDFFPGVTTVVLKLFNIIKPHLAVFGQKDYQQLVTIRRMVRDLHLEIDVIGRPTVREPDGLAMSSRNTYLKPEERHSALGLYSSMMLAKEMIESGKRDAAEILDAVGGFIESRPGARVQYAVLADPATLEPVEAVEGPVLLALAVFVGKTRLIDNMVLSS